MGVLVDQIHERLSNARMYSAPKYAYGHIMSHVYIWGNVHVHADQEIARWHWLHRPSSKFTLHFRALLTYVLTAFFYSTAAVPVTLRLSSFN